MYNALLLSNGFCGLFLSGHRERCLVRNHGLVEKAAGDVSIVIPCERLALSLGDLDNAFSALRNAMDEDNKLTKIIPSAQTVLWLPSYHPNLTNSGGMYAFVPKTQITGTMGSSKENSPND